MPLAGRCFLCIPGILHEPQTSFRSRTRRPPINRQGGSVSRIVPTLAEGAGVTTTRAHVQYIVTEYGVAFLHGRSIRERARALIDIAHPDFRAQLTGWARQHAYL